MGDETANHGKDSNDAPPEWLLREEEISRGSTLGVAWAALCSGWRLRLQANKAVSAADLSFARSTYVEAATLLSRAEGLARLELAQEDGFLSSDMLFHRAAPGAGYGCEVVEDAFPGQPPRAAWNTARTQRCLVESNLSLVCLRLGDATSARLHATSSLDINGSNVKSLYRRALASLDLSDPKAATADLQAALALSPANREVKIALRQCAQADSKPATTTPPTNDLSVRSVRADGANTATSVDAGSTGGASVGGPGGDDDVSDDVDCQDTKKNKASDSCSQIMATKNERAVGGEARPSKLSRELEVATELPQSRPSVPSAAGASPPSPCVFSRDGCGHTPLHKAAANGTVNVAEALLDAGADPDAIDAEERTPLHLAAIHDHDRIAAYLLEANAAPDRADRYGRTPLYYAGVRNHKEVVAVLVEKGKADQSVLFHALKEKFQTHNFMLHDWPEYNGRWMTSKEGRSPDVPLRAPTELPLSPSEVQSMLGR
eukprot:TRINITY_DN74962_c0_g1_i1.p1 TRINITY_DN74962_c0_g1~~TRINITY_DN74962_c0_g1_i1.p1  ORF type:complete len:490 (-),score=87.34 TRINITY_DN74962_c0_g1_i1:31-1500(-)